MRFLFIAALITIPLAGQADTARKATLTITGNSTCNHGGRIDVQTSTDVIPLTLPPVDGPVQGKGKYSVSGTLGPYTLSGPSASSGHVRDDSDLVLTYGQWNYNGEWMNSSAPFVPTQGQPVVIPLDPGAETVVSFTNAGPPEAPCTGQMVYKIDFTRETQVWQVSLPGHVRLVYHNRYEQVDPATGVYSPLNYTHGFTFRYKMAAEVTLEKRKGSWQYKSGTVTQAQVAPEYEQAPPLYQVTGQSCARCNKVAALKGTAIGGTSDGKTLTLNWPDIRPAATVYSKFAMKCAPGPSFSSCQNKIKYGTSFSDDEGYFLWRAGEQVLPLQDGPHAFKDGKPTNTSTLEIVHNYNLMRVK
ncbi:hypothetical protein RXV86_11560 [Alisedimentitalea sp. MJ-SS2]|uniref:hypothetical protein n=1 Tax=Aliisedimentitalea sp. MJ-SS2 TaxID=3049795 RepID=UPI00290B7515|nr:hypothetical protein [Alisedimentitalea sp. MJ-SS2]MDU8928023.1 hypothetical protein [Alisedimentitalea sp. MJ-SS2]